MPFQIVKQDDSPPIKAPIEAAREIHSTLDALRLTQQERAFLYALIEPELLSPSPKNQLLDFENSKTSTQKKQPLSYRAMNTADVDSDLPRPFGMLIEVADIDRAWREWNQNS
jgi:hypothetical protein